MFLTKKNKFWLDRAVRSDNFNYHYPILEQTKQILNYRLIKTILMILSVSYFVAIMWRIYVTIIIEWENNEEVDVYNGKETFYSCQDYGFVDNGIEMGESHQLIRFIYYMLTTLSTIGYGDFLPKSVKEKVFISIVMFIGLTIFSLIVN